MKKLLALLFLSSVIGLISCTPSDPSATKSTSAETEASKPPLEGTSAEIAVNDIPAKPLAEEMPVVKVNQTDVSKPETNQTQAVEKAPAPAQKSDKKNQETQKTSTTGTKENATSTSESPMTSNKETTTPPKVIEKETATSKPQTTVPEKEKATVKEVEKETPPSHQIWDELLRKHVSAAGKVDYKGFKAELAKFSNYLKELADHPVKTEWSKDEKMAYWINAYNAFTIKLIVDNYPTSSITNINGGKPWDLSWIKLGDKTYSLNNIENDILRPQFKDPRIHFAVNCAAKSCPPLRNRAWTAANLNSNFEQQAKAFINNPAFNSISSKEVKLSKIFDWYGSDFGELIPFLNKYANSPVNAGAKAGFMEYNWALNE